MSPLARLLALLVRAYQLVLRPILPPACKFVPSCSEYTIGALRTHGAVRGLMLAVWRLLRCNPFTAGGYDPVPEPHADGPHGGTFLSPSAPHAACSHSKES